MEMVDVISVIVPVIMAVILSFSCVYRAAAPPIAGFSFPPQLAIIPR
jgi:hypothetical protein